MANIELKVEDSYAAIDTYGYGESFHQLSDGSLVVVIRKLQGSVADWEVYWSIDNGNTWTLEFTIFTSASYAYSTDWVGDKCYMLFVPQTTSTALLFYRVDYDASAKTFSLAINGTEVRASGATVHYSYGSCDVEPGGRLWATYQRNVSGSPTVEASYSDDGGSSWTQSTGLGGWTGGIASKIGVHCLAGNTVVLWNSNSGGNQFVSYAFRLHTDSNNSWSSVTQTLGISGAATQPIVQSCKDALSPSKRIYAVILEQSNAAGNGLRWMELVEGASPYTLTENLRPTSGSIAAPAGQNTYILTMGLNNGFTLFYVHSGSVGTLRYRKIANGDTSWPSESTYSFSVTPNAYNHWSSTDRIPYDVSESAFLIGYRQNGDSTTRPWFLLQNVTSPVTLDGDFPVEILADLNLTADLPTEELTTLNLTGDLPIERLAAIVFVMDAEIEWLGLWLAIFHQFTVLTPLNEVFFHTFQVAAQDLIDLLHTFTVQEQIVGGEFVHAFTIVGQKLIPNFGEDPQLPYALVTKET